MVSNKKTLNLFLISLASLIIIELVSFLATNLSWLSFFVGIIVVVLTLYFSLQKTAYGFLILLVELVVGSQGYLLSFNIDETRLSIRIALWIVVMSVWLYREIKYLIDHKKISPELQNFKYLKAFGILGLVLIFALVVGFLKDNDLSIIFIEAKRWFYIIAIIPMIALLKTEDNKKFFWPVVSAAALLIAIKTALLVYVFLHGIVGYESIYNWLRHNWLGEITLLSNGFSRVFLQSQIFAIPAFLLSITLFNTKKKISYGLFAAIFLATIITSLSRSFWLGTLIAWLITSIFLLRNLRPLIKNLSIMAAQNLAVVVAGFCLLYLAAQFPFPKPLASLDPSLISDRATQFEAAAASRWNLLPVMWQSISASPVLGQGLGKTLTYKTNDPRVLKNSPDGIYTTNAFEWGWLDLWLKLGLLGLIAYFYIFFVLIKDSILSFKASPLISSVTLGAISALVIVHIFTPYLNHPLGFGYLALLGIISSRLD